MDGKRHPSSFQQLEKLGEGTYATVSRPLCSPKAPHRLRVGHLSGLLFTVPQFADRTSGNTHRIES